MPAARLLLAALNAPHVEAGRPGPVEEPLYPRDALVLSGCPLQLSEGYQLPLLDVSPSCRYFFSAPGSLVKMRPCRDAWDMGSFRVWR